HEHDFTNLVNELLRLVMAEELFTFVLVPVREVGRMRIMIYEPTTLRHQLNRRTVRVAGTVFAPSQAPGPTAGRPARRPQCHPLPGPLRLPMAAVAPRLPALEHGPHLVSPLASGRHLGQDPRGAAAAGPSP